MRRHSREIFTTVRTEGALLPIDILQRIAEGDRELEGLTPESYHLGPNEKLNEAINRAWSRCLGAWRAFKSLAESLSPSDTGTTLTRERWLLILFQELGYGRLLTAKTQEIDGKTYPISHAWGQVPIHLVSFRQDLDHRSPGVAGAARMSPHSLVQEFLNRSKDHLWGMVSNGLHLRLLRDNATLTRQAFVDFHLEDMMSGEVYSDFALLYMLLHQSRLEPERPEYCWLEIWSQEAQKRGTRALEQLRDGVEQALSALGQGFLAQPVNSELRAKLQSGALSPQGLYEQLLRLVYRLIFLFVAEDRDLLLLQEAPKEVKSRYLENYSLSRIRRIAERLRGTRHGDLWQGLLVTFRCLKEGNAALGLGPLGGFLFSDQALPDLVRCELSNSALLAAIRHLAFTQDKNILRPVDYRNLGTEELGSVYESLLELHPQVNLSASSFELRVAAGSKRKTTGSYYTPSSLINSLLDSALEPVIAARLERARELGRRESASLGRDIYVRHILSGPQSLAESHGFGRGLLPPDQDVPFRGTLRDGFADQTLGHLDPGEYRGRLGQGNNEGISSVPQGGPRQYKGVGDSFAPVSASRANPSSSERTGAGASVGDLPHDHFPDWFFAAQAEVGFDSLVPYSLLAEKALLSLKIVDPAAGSGHFLIAAAHRMARHLAMVRTGESEPSPEERRKALRDVVSHCIYGVDINPLAVELCKVALWMETLDPGRPLGFLDHRIKCGNSLIGATPELMENGIPDDAFKPLEGDEKDISNSIRKRNRQERKGQRRLLKTTEPALDWLKAIKEFKAFSDLPEELASQVSEKAALYQDLYKKESFRHERQVADLWTAAFFWPLTRETLDTVPTQDVFLRVREGKEQLKEQAARILEEITSRHRFFHWHLEFPEVFSPSPSLPHSLPLSTPSLPGFDCILGNPPWEQIQLEEQEFFASRDRQIADAPNAAARKRLIDTLRKENPELWQAYRKALQAAESGSRFFRASGFYPFTGRGRINTYSVFAERMRTLVRPGGRMGIIVPTGIATDDTNKFFFAELVSHGELASLYDFENRKGIFPDVHRSYKFSLLTIRKAPDHSPFATGHSPVAEFAFFCQEAADLTDPERRFTLAPEDFRLLNPNTRTAPIFRSRSDAELTKHIYRRVPVLVREEGSSGESRVGMGNPWGVEFRQGLFNMASHSGLFRTREQLEAEGYWLEGNVFVPPSPPGRGVWGEGRRYLPLYEAKMVHQFDHRFGDYAMHPPGSQSTQLPEVPLDRLADPGYRVLPRYWVPEAEVEARLAAKGWNRGWLLGWRDICRSTDERTVISAVIPGVGVGDTFLLALPAETGRGFGLLSGLNTLIADFAARQKVGGTHLKFHTFKQLPVLPPAAFEQQLPFPWEPDHSPFAVPHSPPPVSDFVRPRVLELTYTAWDLEDFARDLGYNGPPFRYDPERRFILRCELDALFFHLYLGSGEEWEREATAELKALFPSPREAVAYILDQFPIVRRKDEERFGEYRTKHLILEIYDAMERAMATGERYQTILDPSPGPPAHPLPPWPPGTPKPPDWPPHIHPPKGIYEKLGDPREGG